MRKEYLDIVDEKGSIVGKDTRESLHKSPKKIHRVVHVLLVNSKGQILIQQRSFKQKLGAGGWEISAGGHVDCGEKTDHAAQRELYEELGIKCDLKLIDKDLFRFDNESELAYLYVGRCDGPLKIDKKEIERVVFVNMEDLSRYFKKNKGKCLLEYWLPTIIRNKKIIFEKF